MTKTSMQPIVRKELVLSFSTITYLEAEQVDPHRNLCIQGVSRRCDNNLLQQQEYGGYDEEE